MAILVFVAVWIDLGEMEGRIAWLQRGEATDSNSLGVCVDTWSRALFLSPLPPNLASTDLNETRA